MDPTHPTLLYSSTVSAVYVVHYTMSIKQQGRTLTLATPVFRKGVSFRVYLQRLLKVLNTPQPCNMSQCLVK